MWRNSLSPVALTSISALAIATGVLLPASAQAASLARPSGHTQPHSFQSAAAPTWPILPANMRAPQGLRLGASSAGLRSGQRLNQHRLRALRVAQHRQNQLRLRMVHVKKLRQQQALRMAQRHALRLAHHQAWGRQLRVARAPEARVLPRLAYAQLPKIPQSMGLAAAQQASAGHLMVGAGRWDAKANALVVPVRGQLGAGSLHVVRLNARWSYLDIPSARPSFGGVAWDNRPTDGVDRWVMAAQPRHRSTRVSLASSSVQSWIVERTEGALLLRPVGGEAMAHGPHVPQLLSMNPNVLPKLPGVMGRTSLAKDPSNHAAAMRARSHARLAIPGAVANTHAPRLASLNPPPAVLAKASATVRSSLPKVVAQAPLATPANPSASGGATAPQPQSLEAQAPNNQVAKQTAPNLTVALGKPELLVARASSNAAHPSTSVAPVQAFEDAMARSQNEDDTQLDAAETTPDGHLALRFHGRTPAYRLQRTSATTASLTFPSSRLRVSGGQSFVPSHHPSLQEGRVQQNGQTVQVDLRMTQNSRIGVYVDQGQKRLVVMTDGAPSQQERERDRTSPPEGSPPDDLNSPPS